ncbi:MAG: hypothetical protein JWO80_5332 [Bryobacterales bacterium]|nr:hypothetical protein [Bryobacterales bacterium]
MKIDRRAVLQGLAAGAAELVIPNRAPAQNPGHSHDEVAPVTAKTKAPAYLTAQQYRLLAALCQMIIPAEETAGGAIEAGVPEFIDLLARENPEYGRQVSGGLLWIDSWCQDHHGKVFVDCMPHEQSGLLDLIAFRENAIKDPSLAAGVGFFAILRDLTLDAFFTSRAGIDYLGFLGNSAMTEFRGCPERQR